jgi:hypothetical protein
MVQVLLLILAMNTVIIGMFAYGGKSDQRQHDLQEPILQRATDAVGMPAVGNFQERRMLKSILEARDQVTPTTVYMVGSNGHLLKICDAIGYGIPSGTQFTNPAQFWQPGVALPQAEPNALFNPPMAEGTWIVCIDPTSKAQQVVYIQPRVIVSPFPLATN